MGAGDSKLSFKKDVFRLSEEHSIPANDPYWLSFWELPESAADVFTLFSAADIRRTRDAHLENLETLIIAVTNRLFTLRHHPSFPDPDIAPERDALNCIRILTRLLPFIFEKESLEEWERSFFWGPSRKKVKSTSIVRTEVIFDEATEDQRSPVSTVQPNIEDGDTEPTKPLMEELIDTLVDMLFYVGFTLPRSYATKTQAKVPYSIWQSGVGCTVQVPTTKELESNKIETLRLLLSITSKSMFTPAGVLPVKGTNALTYLTTRGEKKVTLSVLCSLLNTTLKYNPATWRVPYDHIVFSDPRRVLVSYSVQLLLVLLVYPVPESAGDVKNNYRHWLGRLHRTEDFQFMVDGMNRIMSQPIQAHTSYLPGSQKALKWAPEMIMLFWETLQVNKRFRSFIIDTDRAYDFVVLILFYALEHRLEPSKSGVVRMCIFVLQTLSAEPKFGKSLNKRFEAQNTLPQSMIIPGFSGTYADYLIMSIYNLITTSKGKLSAVYPALLATVANIAPHIKNLSGAASTKLIQLFISMSAPSFLLGNETNHNLLSSLLESINAIIEHQYSENAHFIYAIIRSSKRFEALRSFTLESGQEEIDRQSRAKKDRGGEGMTETPKASFDETTERRNRSKPVEEPQSPSRFAIGDDEDSDEEAAEEQTKTPPPNTQSPSPPPPQSRETPPSVEDAVPHQLRGMSEKARGKMPERQNSTASVSSQNSTSLSGAHTPTGGFTPTSVWIESWLPHLPLHTIVTLIQELEPQVRAHVAKSNAPGADPNTATSVLSFIRNAQIRGIDPSPIKTHLFEWSNLALGWYESLLWGCIFVSEMDVSKGNVGVWNGTTVKLFRVQETASEGPSLLAPRGAVDAIGTTLVERLGGVAISARGRGGQHQQPETPTRRSLSREDNGGDDRDRGGLVV